ncbi:MAG: HD-GYP domain-containing protein, partial [bacterium]
LSGQEIPLFGRILAVGDAIDAMLSDRHYRTGLPIDIVRDELDTNKETQFDPEFAEIGLTLLTPENTAELPDLFSQAVTQSD